MDADDIELSIEQIYELSPLQQAMLFHGLVAPGSGAYVMQESLRLTGALDVAAFRRAWRHVIARHGALRTAFFWEELEKPMQVVFRRAEVEVAWESWRDAGPGEQRARLERYLDAELARGFDLAAPPLTRLALFELDAGVHQLVWTQHHMVIDGWSRGLLLQELFACYRAFADGGEPRLERAGSYGAYIDWLQRREPGEAEAYWRQALAGFAAPTLLAGDGSPAAQPHFADSRQRGRALSAAATADLRAMARRHRLTLNTLVQGAWALVLARTLGVEDVVFGATVAGRPEELPGVEAIVGLFINTLPLRVEVPPVRRLEPWLAELQRRNVELRRHEQTPLVDVQRWSGLPAGTALFDHLLAFENAPLDRELSRLVPELAVAAAAARNLTNYPLNLLVFPAAALWLEIVYDRRRFAATEAARLLERLAGLLAAFAADPDLPLGELPLLLPGERQQVLAEWAAGAEAGSSDPGAGELLHELFARQAARSPRAVAVELGAERWTYRRLLASADRLARHLRELGVGPDVVVALAAERSPAMVVGMLAALRAGGAYLPLDPTYPADRLAFMLADSGARVLLAQEPLLARLPAADARVVVLDERWDSGDLPDDQPDDQMDPEPPLDASATPDNLAYVIYTSGSTGRPKGVMVPHRGAVHYLSWCLGAYGLAPGAASLVHSPLGFDLTVTALWGPLLAGGRVELVPEREGVDGLAAALARSAYALVKLTPTHLELLSHQLAAGSLAGRVGALVGVLIIGGEALFAESLAPWRLHATATRLINEYGPTETVVGCAVHEVSAGDPPAGAVPIGRPLGGSRLYVVDRELRPLPIGAPGELVVGGAGVTRGYLRRPGLTAERFVPDPFGASSGHQPGARLYRTGDLARWSVEGRLEYLGRLDSQVKVRGYRIEPGEIEAVLGEHPDVRDCAVVVRRDPPGDARLAAYVVPRPGAALAERSLREHAERSLPEPMRPSSYRLLASLPLTPNGKLDRAALPAPEAGPGDEGEGWAAPRDPLEGVLAGIWEEVLGRPRIGAHDDFFALGGHSLLATRVASRVRSVLAVEIPVRRVFEARTVAALARAVREEQEERLAAPPLPPLAPVPRDGDLPLSFAQQRLWFIAQLAPGSAAYNLAAAYRARGPLDAGALAVSLTELARRHEALRTVFARGADGPVQVIVGATALSLPAVDLSGLAPPGRPGQVAIEIETEVERLRAAEAARPFDLARGPLLRTALLSLGPEDHVVLFTLHHIVGDGWSNGVLVHDLTALYEACRQGRPSPLPPLPIQYADFAVWQRGWLAGPPGEAQLAYWRAALAGAPPVLDLPTDRPRPPVQSFRGSSEPFLLPAELCRPSAPSGGGRGRRRSWSSSPASRRSSPARRASSTSASAWPSPGATTWSSRG